MDTEGSIGSYNCCVSYDKDNPESDGNYEVFERGEDNGTNEMFDCCVKSYGGSLEQESEGGWDSVGMASEQVHY